MQGMHAGLHLPAPLRRRQLSQQPVFLTSSTALQRPRPAPQGRQQGGKGEVQI